MREPAIFVVEVRHEKAGVCALVRAAASASAEVFTSADALWRFLAQENAAPAADGATPEQRPPA